MDNAAFNDHMILCLSNDPIGTLVSSDPPANLEELSKLVALWDDYSVAKRQVTVSHIRTIGLAAVTAIAHRRNQLGVLPRKQVDLRCVPCDPAWLSAHIFELEPKLFGMKRSESFPPAVSSLRVALRRVGLLDGDLPTIPPDPGPWRFLLDALATRGSLYAHGLAHFAEWCSRQGIMPAYVEDATLVAYEGYLRTRTLRRDIPGHIRNVAKAWRRAKTMIAELPDREIKAVSRRKFYVLPLTAYPESFQRDAAAYLAMRSFTTRGGPFTRGGPKQRWRPASAKKGSFSIRQAARDHHEPGRSCRAHRVREHPHALLESRSAEGGRRWPVRSRGNGAEGAGQNVYHALGWARAAGHPAAPRPGGAGGLQRIVANGR